MFDPVDTFAAGRTGGGHLKSLRIERVAEHLAQDLEERGDRFAFVSGDKQKRINYYPASDPSHATRLSPRSAGQLLRRRFLAKWFHGKVEADVLVQRAGAGAIWAQIADLVAAAHSENKKPDAASTWVLEHIEKGDGYILREEMIDRYTSEFPGPRSVRARELSAALREEKLSDLSTDPRIRIGGEVTRIVPGVQFKPTQLKLPIRTDDPFLTFSAA